MVHHCRSIEFRSIAGAKDFFRVTSNENVIFDILTARKRLKNTWNTEEFSTAMKRK